MKTSPHILIVDAPYYREISASLMEGVAEVLTREGATHDYVAVPGVLEIPAAIAFAEASAKPYDGYVVIGCVIRGETTHYDIVANESARALMDLTVSKKLALGNGIQTVENEAQAWARARKSEKNKGGGAAEAAIAMIRLRAEFGS
jgi:6,7-dimethyl-8-ribityllumazine synthase